MVFFFLIRQVVLSLRSGLLTQLLAKDPLRTALWQLSSCLENYFLSGGGEVALACPYICTTRLSILLH